MTLSETTVYFERTRRYGYFCTKTVTFSNRSFFEYKGEQGSNAVLSQIFTEHHACWVSRLVFGLPFRWLWALHPISLCCFALQDGNPARGIGEPRIIRRTGPALATSRYNCSHGSRHAACRKLSWDGAASRKWLLCRLRVTNFLSWLQIKWILFFSLSILLAVRLVIVSCTTCLKNGHTSDKCWFGGWNQAPRCCEAISWG